MRLAEAADLPAVIGLTEAAYAPYTPVLGASPVPVTEDYAPRIAAGEVYLLEVEAVLGGLIVLERHDDHAMIFSVAVAPAQHGRGFGSALLAFAEQKAREWGLGEVRLYTNALMERNLAIYAAKGYRETGRHPNPRRPSFIAVDMVKTIERQPIRSTPPI